MRQALTRAVHAAAATLLLAACSGADKEPIVIGVAGPVNKATGASMKRAVEMAVEEINSAGGVADGRLLALRIEDDNGDSEQAIRVATQLRGDARVLAVIGHVNSGATLKAAPVYNTPAGELAGDTVLEDTEPVVAVSPASSNPDVSRAGEWIFRVVPSDHQHAPTLAGLARERLGRRRAAILYTNDDYGRGLMEGFAASFGRNGASIVSRDPYLPAQVESSAGLEPYLTRAFRQNPDVLLIAGPADGALRIIQEARRMGFAGPIVGGDGLTSLKDAGAAAEGLFVSSAYLPDSSDEHSREFVQKYQRKYGELPDHRGAMAYDVVYLLRDVIRRAGADRAAIRTELARVGSEGGLTFDMVTGPIRFDTNGDVIEKPVVVGVIRNGRLVTAAR